MFYTSKPQHPFPVRPICPPYVVVICSKTRKNKKGEPYGIGKISYQPSKNRYIVICYDRECDSFFGGQKH